MTQAHPHHSATAHVARLQQWACAIWPPLTTTTWLDDRTPVYSGCDGTVTSRVEILRISETLTRFGSPDVRDRGEDRLLSGPSGTSWYHLHSVALTACFGFAQLAGTMTVIALNNAYDTSIVRVPVIRVGYNNFLSALVVIQTIGSLLLLMCEHSDFIDHVSDELTGFALLWLLGSGVVTSLLSPAMEASVPVAVFCVGMFFLNILRSTAMSMSRRTFTVSEATLRRTGPPVAHLVMVTTPTAIPTASTTATDTMRRLPASDSATVLPVQSYFSGDIAALATLGVVQQPPSLVYSTSPLGYLRPPQQASSARIVQVGGGEDHQDDHDDAPTASRALGRDQQLVTDVDAASEGVAFLASPQPPQFARQQGLFASSLSLDNLPGRVDRDA